MGRRRSRSLGTARPPQPPSSQRDPHTVACVEFSSVGGRHPGSTIIGVEIGWRGQMGGVAVEVGEWGQQYVT